MSGPTKPNPILMPVEPMGRKPKPAPAPRPRFPMILNPPTPGDKDDEPIPPGREPFVPSGWKYEPIANTKGGVLFNGTMRESDVRLWLESSVNAPSHKKDCTEDCLQGTNYDDCPACRIVFIQLLSDAERAAEVLEKAPTWLDRLKQWVVVHIWIKGAPR